MPKVIFRPNPTPPPFVPPTPIYPENSISFSPATFNIGQSVVATIHKVVTTPETTKIELYFNIGESGVQKIEEISVEPNYIDNVVVPFVAEFNFDNLANANIRLWNGLEYDVEVFLTLTS